jgi:YVTN family beta-propeller protein
MVAMSARQMFVYGFGLLGLALMAANFSAAQTPSPALLVLEKSDDSLAIVDPANLKIVGRVPVGLDPHEIVASADGKVAYVSNYGGTDSALNTIAVVDLTTQKPLQPINLGALHSAHGLAFASGKLYFTVETNKAFGRYDPAAQTIDWILGTGQDRTHMIVVSQDLERVFTSNVNSGTISIIEQTESAFPPQASLPGAGGPPGGNRKTWHVTTVASGRGSEGFDVSPDGKQIWAANAQDATVTIIDIAGKKAVETFAIPISRANRLKFTRDGKRVLVSGLGASPGAAPANAVVLDAATHKELKRLNFGGGSGGILISPDDSHAYVAVSEKNKVAVIDLKTLGVAGEIPVGRNPDGLAWAQR